MSLGHYDSDTQVDTGDVTKRGGAVASLRHNMISTHEATLGMTLKRMSSGRDLLGMTKKKDGAATALENYMIPTHNSTLGMS